MIGSSIYLGNSSTTITQFLVQPGFISIGNWAGRFQLCYVVPDVNRHENFSHIDHIVFHPELQGEFFFPLWKLTDTNMTAIPLIFFLILLSASWLNIRTYESNNTVSVKHNSRVTEWKKIACCAVVQTFSRSNHDKKVFTWPNATILMIKYSCVLAEVLVKCWGLER